MASHHPVLRKAPPLQAEVPSSNSNNNRPLPPLPPPEASTLLQKPPPVPQHKRNVSSTSSLKPTERLTETPSAPRPPIADQSQIATTNRPSSATSGSDSEAGFTAKLKKRSSWLSGAKSRSRHTSKDNDEMKASAWIRQEGKVQEYSLRPLLNAQKVPELWNESGDCLVYLFPPATNRGPSFRIGSHLLSSSQLLLKMLQSEPANGHQRQGSVGRHVLPTQPSRQYGTQPLATPPISPHQYPVDNQSWYDDFGEPLPMFREASPGPSHLYFPTGILSIGPDFTKDEEQRLVDARNLFAFLKQDPLVGTPKRNDSFLILMGIARTLQGFQFRNMSGSTYGEAAELACEHFFNTTSIGDVRESREKTVEALVLAEAIRSPQLYNEAYAHAAGKWRSILDLNPPILKEISQTTRTSLERSDIALQERKRAVADRLTDFRFYSIFSGIAASTSSPESKFVHFSQWQANFVIMRKFILRYYKTLHGQWPPKASSKKNQFVEGGLNRLVLGLLYKDLCQLYSLLVDRTALTTRATDKHQIHGNVDPTHEALRKLLDEYDRSNPPVQPAVPFDVPLIPTVATVNPGLPNMDPRDQLKNRTRKLKSHETLLILTKSHNLDADTPTNFIQCFKEFEHEQSQGKNAQELADMRYGHWIFMYAVIQSLPLLAVDAPGVKHTEGVEYFLCQAAHDTTPWMETSLGSNKNWYDIQNGQGLVQLPPGVVEHGVEAVYRRSHCWNMASKWLAGDNHDISSSPSNDTYDVMSPLEPPPGLAGGEFGSRPQSRGRTRGDGNVEFNNGFASLSLSTNQSISRDRSAQRVDLSAHRRSVAIGLEKVQIPADGPYGGWSPNTPLPQSGSGGGYSSSRSVSPHPGYEGSRNASASYQGGLGPDANSRAGGVSPGPSSAKSNSAGSGGNTGATFDDILGAIENSQKSEQGKSKGWGKKK